VDGDVLHSRPRDDEWSCRELVSHMAEMERRYIGWLERIVRLDEPAIEPFDGDTIEPATPIDEQDIFEMMDEFGALRRQAVYLLASLDEQDWDRRGMHPYLGPLTLLQVAREMNEHDLAHLWQLRKLCDVLEAAPA
jgi:hypothetical protein